MSQPADQPRGVDVAEVVQADVTEAG